MLTDELPILGPDATMKEAIVQLAKRRGICLVQRADATLLGVVTTGDLTRLMQAQGDVMGVKVSDVMSKTPRTVHAEELGSAAVHLMETSGIIALPVLDAAETVVGVVHLHDLMRAGAA
jgi:arabinose-5-phosphate isomerase